MLTYVVLAHRSAALLRRSISRLMTSRTHFDVHVDKKSEIGPFEWALHEMPERAVNFVNRVDARWGEFSLVQATLNGLNAAAESGREWTHCILISGQTYPIRPAASIASFFEEHPQKSFLSHSPLPEDKRDRIERYHFSFRGWRHSYPSGTPVTTLKAKVREMIFALRFRKPRHHLLSSATYHGSQWWGLSREAVLYILDYVRRDPDYVTYHHYSHVPDEMFFHTILANAEDEAVRTNLVNRDLHFSDWEPGETPSPRVLTSADLPRLADSDCLYARKFDTAVDAGVLDAIDSELLGVK